MVLAYLHKVNRAFYLPYISFMGIEKRVYRERDVYKVDPHRCIISLQILYRKVSQTGSM